MISYENYTQLFKMAAGKNLSRRDVLEMQETCNLGAITEDGIMFHTWLRPMFGFLGRRKKFTEEDIKKAYAEYTRICIRLHEICTIRLKNGGM